MNNKSKVVVGLGITATALAITAAMSGKKTDLSGMVTDSVTGAVIQEAKVMFHDITAKSVLTDDSGKYVISGISVNSYTVSFTKDGYISMVKTVVIKSGANTLNAQMSPGTQPPSAVPSITVTPTTLKVGETLSYTISNFTPNDVVTVRVIAEDGTISNTVTINSDNNGVGTGTMVINNEPGLYLLNAIDESNDNASAQFVLKENLTGLIIAPSGDIPKVAVNYGLQFSARVTNADGTTKDVTGEAAFLLWNSSNPSVATIGWNGSVLGIAIGTTVITATYKGLNSNPVSLQVVATPAEASEPTPYSINITPLNPANLFQYAGQQFDAFIRYTADAQYVYHENTLVHWKSSNPAVASVSNYGVVTGVTPGTTQIYCVYGGVESNRITLTVIAPIPGTTSVSGRVIDAITQSGISGVTVTVGSASVNTDINGDWYMQNINPGAVYIILNSQGYDTQTITDRIMIPGANNNVGTMSLFKITNTLINLQVSGVTADIWQISINDVRGKYLAVGDIPLAQTQKIYIPDDWVFPFVFWIFAYKLIDNRLNQVAYWQSGWPGSAGYINAKFTDPGNYTMNMATGLLTKTG